MEWALFVQECFFQILKMDIIFVTAQTRHRRSQDFVWGALFSSKKVDDLFTTKWTSKYPPPSQKCPKIDSCYAWGCTWCAGGALTNVPYFFSALGCRCTHGTPCLRLYETRNVAQIGLQIIAEVTNKQSVHCDFQLAETQSWKRDYPVPVECLVELSAGEMSLGKYQWRH